MQKSKKWTLCCLLTFIVAGILLGSFTIIVDPFFHYHKPLERLEYPLYLERYQNDGIINHFQYDAILTGTSMTQNFKASELNEIFGVNSIKVCFSGGSYKEINENLERALNSNKDVKMIIRGLDYSFLLEDKDWMRYETYPQYLYDNNPWNDVQYFLNKEILFNNTAYVINYTEEGNKTTNFDTYSNWMTSYKFGKEALDQVYKRTPEKKESMKLTESEQQTVKDTVNQNILLLAEKYPDVTFYLFFTPYSIYYWDELNQAGLLERQLEAEKIAIELMLPIKNIKLFSFFDDFTLICDLNNYKDTMHYGEWVNSKILQWLYEDKHLLSTSNYMEYCNKVREFYTDYNYDIIHFLRREMLDFTAFPVFFVSNLLLVQRKKYYFNRAMVSRNCSIVL